MINLKFNYIKVRKNAKNIRLFVCFWAGSANANLITNGDFSTGDISGWTLTGGSYSVVSNEVFLEYDNYGWSVLSQDIFTVSGQVYDISFDAYASQLSGNDFAWAIDGVLNNIATTTSWFTNTGTFTGTGGSTNIAFYMATDLGTGIWHLDDISVASGVSVPEPSILALLGLGLSGIVVIRRKAKA